MLVIDILQTFLHLWSDVQTPSYMPVPAQTPSPTLSLPWNTYTATYHPKTSGIADIYKWSNVRFGDAPTGTQSFGAPQTPIPGRTPPDPVGEIQCHNFHPPDPSKLARGSPPFLGDPKPGNNIFETEDCLFLDLYVPKSALENNGSPPKLNTPIIAWIYGGAFEGGAKLGNGTKDDIIFDGTGLINTAANFSQDVIYVVGNYRLGAFGWLAGSYVEENALPNAGLYDQRLFLQWIQDYIGQVGGNASDVSVWGESAGASSILHHLILDGGKIDPLFRKAAIMSPAFEWQWDRAGTLNVTYNNFTELVGCEDHGVGCLREFAMDDPALINANNVLLNSQNFTGVYAVGPAVDGKIIKDLAPLELARGSFFSNLTSILITHVDDEATGFVPSWIKTEDNITQYIQNFLPQPSNAALRQKILNQYACDNSQPRDCLAAIIRDLSFTCNTRYLFNAYSPTYMGNYAVDEIVYIKKAAHGTDLAPLYWSPEANFSQFLVDTAESAGSSIPDSIIKGMSAFFGGYDTYFAPRYQSRFVSHAVFGDPNQGWDQDVPWPTAVVNADDNGTLGHVLQAESNIKNASMFVLIDDLQNTEKACNFWLDIASNVTSGSGSTKSMAFDTSEVDADHAGVNAEL